MNNLGYVPPAGYNLGYVPPAGYNLGFNLIPALFQDLTSFRHYSRLWRLLRFNAGLPLVLRRFMPVLTVLTSDYSGFNNINDSLMPVYPRF